MSDPVRPTASKRVLEPIERISEVLFGLIMVLTFTGSLSAATAGHAEIRTMLIGALGCNLAWGVIDGLLYLMGSLAGKARDLAPPERPSLEADDWKGALGVFLLVFVSTLPVVVPFLLMGDAIRALRISNAIAVSLLFVCGYAFGRLTRYHAWLMGLAMVFLGSALVAMTMALGG